MAKFTIHYYQTIADNVVVEAESKEAARKMFEVEGPNCGESSECPEIVEEKINCIEVSLGEENS